MPIYAECLTRAKMSSTKEENTTVRSPIGREWFETSHIQKVLEDAHFENVHVSIFESRWSFANQDECAKVFTQFWFFKQILKDANLTDEQREKYDQVVHQVLLDMIGKEPDQPFDLPMIAQGQKPAE
jgi:hypothetical protein